MGDGDADILRARVSRLEALIHAGHLLNSTLSLDMILQRMMSLGTALLDAQRATLFVLDPEREELWSKVATDLGRLAEIRMPRTAGLAGHVAATGETLRVPDAYTLPFFNPEFDRRSGFHTTSVLCTPVRNARGQTLGVLQVLNRRHGEFDAEDEEILRALADQAAVAIQTSLLHQELMLIQQLEHDVQMASEVQQLMMASSPPAFVPSLDVATFFRAAHVVGGDFYEVGPAGPHGLLLALGDVSGKGLAAALLMAGLLSTLRLLAQEETSPARIVRRLNDLMLARPVGHLLATVFVACFDSRTRRLRHCNGGHVPGLIARRDGILDVLDSGGLMPGVLADQDYDEGETLLEEGDVLLLSTDGFSDSVDGGGMRLGPGGVRRLLKAASAGATSAAEVLRSLQDGARAVTKDAGPVDDLTLVVARGGT